MMNLASPSCSRLVVGVDGCKDGWVAVLVRDDLLDGALLVTSIQELDAVAADAAGVAIDIPIGLPVAGPRLADLAARAHLGARRSSVFQTPPRAVLTAHSFEEANLLARELIGTGVSKQAMALGQKILEVEAWLPDAPCPVWEVHPEVSFSMLLGAPATASKRTWGGVLERREALIAAGIDVDSINPSVALHAAPDDILDACVAAWSAVRIAMGTAVSLPSPPEVGVDGRPIAIWA